MTLTIEGDIAHLLASFRAASAKRRDAATTLDANRSPDAEAAFRNALDAELAAAHFLALSIDHRTTEGT